MTNIHSEKIQVAWLAGMPRSGTTWLSQIFASSPDVRLKFCPLFSYDFKNALNENSSAEEWARLFSEVYHRNSEFLDQDHLRKHGLVPVFKERRENPGHLIIKSNRFHNLIPYLLKLNTGIRIVHIVRHPCATIHSWLSDPDEFPRDANPGSEWRTGKCRKGAPGEFWGFDDWKMVTKQALKLTQQYPDRHRIIRYEDLVKKTQLLTRELFEFLQISYDKQTDDFITLCHSSHSEHKHSVFKNPRLRDRWEELLDPAIVSTCLRELAGTELEQFTVT